MLNRTFLAAGILALAAACQCCNSETEASLKATPTAVAAQIELGGQVYGRSCAGCHGDAGQGTSKGYRLVGEGAFPLNPRPEQERPSQFRSAMDIALFATQNMPPKQHQRDAMTGDEYWAVLAFALSANGVELTEPVTPENAAAIVLHP